MIEMTRTTQSITENRDALIEAELNTLYQVSQVLSRSLQLRETLDEVLKLLDVCGLLSCGMVCLREEDSGELIGPRIAQQVLPAERKRPLSSG